MKTIKILHRLPAATLRISAAVTTITLVLASPAAGQLDGNFDETKVAPYALPDALIMADGRRVRDSAMWHRERRPELLGMFEANIYGVSPASGNLRFRVTDVERNALGGLATRKQVTLYLDGKTDGPQTSVLLYLPNGAGKRRAPIFVGLNFHGNQAITFDPAVAIAHSWVVPGEGIRKNRATAASRGIDAAEWPLEQILKAGYGIATYFPGDLYPDSDDKIAESIQPYYRTSPSDPQHWGAIATWAWGLGRVYDYLARDPQVDAKRVIVFGHSRYGKAALWAGARDQRFAMVVANDSGGGGAKLFRRNYGETIRVMNNYWFAPRYKTFAGREAELPVDQHELIALVAPRPVYIASASEDLWADPRGEFAAAKGADPVYRLLGGDGLDATVMPLPNTPIHSRIGYHLRRGPHAITPYDWGQFIAFADRHLRPGN